MSIKKQSITTTTVVKPCPSNTTIVPTLGGQYSLTMIRGARAVYIGLFPSAYRARTVAFRLGWHYSWQPFIAKV